jgi:hypothetical protein
MLSNARKLIPDPSSAAFPVMSLCLPPLVCIAIGHELGLDIAEKLLAMTAGFVTSPPSILMTKIHAKIIGIRADKMPSEDRKGFLMEWFRRRIGDMFGRTDCYSLSELVFDLCMTVLRVNGFSDLLPFLTAEVFTRAPRFFPVFVGVFEFVRMRISRSKFAHKVEELKDAMKLAGDAMECPGLAMRLMHDLESQVGRD